MSWTFRIAIHVRRTKGAHAWTMDRRARKNVSSYFTDFYAFGFVKRARRSRAGRRLALDPEPTVRARSRTSSQTPSLGPPPRGKRVAPVPPGRRRPTTDDRDRRRRARASAPSPARRILFTPRARSGRYFPISALLRIPPRAVRVTSARSSVSDDRARGRDVARDDRG